MKYRSGSLLSNGPSKSLHRIDTLSRSGPQHMVHIYTTQCELPFAGHPIIGAAIHLAQVWLYPSLSRSLFYLYMNPFKDNITLFDYRRDN